MGKREAVIKIFGCSDCVALEDCVTDKPMNFCSEKRNYLRDILSLIEPSKKRKMGNVR